MPDSPVAERERDVQTLQARVDGLLHLAHERLEVYLVAGPRDRAIAERLMLTTLVEAIVCVAEQHRAIDRDLLDGGRRAALAELATMLATEDRRAVTLQPITEPPPSILQLLAAAVSRNDPGAQEFAEAILLRTPSP